MEIAVPLIALGGLYVSSNQEEKKVKKEGYENMGKPVNSLPNYEQPPINYPKMKPITGNNASPNAPYRDPNVEPIVISSNLLMKTIAMDPTNLAQWQKQINLLV